jgi:hypothetical protein
MKKLLLIIATVLAFSSTALAGDRFTLSAPAVSATKGVKATAFVTITGVGEFGILTEYPLQIQLTAPAGVQLEKLTLTKADATEWRREGAKVPVVFTATELGTKVITGEAKFAVSSNMDVAPQTVKLQITVNVK